MSTTCKHGQQSPCVQCGDHTPEMERVWRQNEARAAEWQAQLELRRLTGDVHLTIPRDASGLTGDPTSHICWTDDSTCPECS